MTAPTPHRPDRRFPGRLALVMLALVAGIAIATFVPGIAQSVRSVVGWNSPTNAAQPPEAIRPREEPAEKEGEDKPRLIKLTEEQIAAGAIDVAVVKEDTIARRIVVPGTIIPHADRLARVSVRLSAIVAELRKKIGDPVAKDELLAILESREVADAKSEYLAARLTNELQQELFERDKALWDKRVSSEQQFLRSRNQALQTQMKLNIARQKLFALGLDEKEIAALPDQPEALLRQQEVRSPIAGRVVERKVDLGTAVGRDNLETELFVIVDLDKVWIDLAVSPADLPLVKEGLSVAISARGVAKKIEGRVVFISPLLDKDTRTARVVAEVVNGDGALRPGSFATALIAVDRHAVPVAVQQGAIQSVGDERVVFVRTADGFEKRVVVLGRSDDRLAEVTSGLEAGETIAVSNTFLLKAELLKGLAED